jgi:hypothetical protein
MIYLIDNDHPYPDEREIFFVEASEGFDRWFNEVLIPWQKKTLVDRGYVSREGYHKIIVVADPGVHLKKPNMVIGVKEYLTNLQFPGEPSHPKPPRFVAKDYKFLERPSELTLFPHLYRAWDSEKYAQPTIMVKTSPLNARKQASVVYAVAALVETVIARTEAGQIATSEWEVQATTSRTWTLGAVTLYSKKYPEREAEAMEILKEACDLYYNQASQEDKDAGITIRKENPHG